MRDPARIARTLSALEHYWHRYPDLRLGQIVGNVANLAKSDPYYIEDDALAEELDAAMYRDTPYGMKPARPPQNPSNRTTRG